MQPKIAVLFSGYIGTITGKQDRSESIENEEELISAICFRHWKKHLLDHFENVDFFIHSWSEQHEDLLVNTFQPKAILTERAFTNSPEMAHLVQKVKANGINCDPWPNTRLSQMISVQRSYDVYEEFCDAQGKTHDVIIFARVDMCLTTRFPAEQLHPNSIYRIESPYHDGPVHGYMDYPIVCTSKDAAKHYGTPAGYYLDPAASLEFTRQPNTLSLHRFAYHIFRLLSEYHGISARTLPGMQFTNFFHSSSVLFCRYLYFSHLNEHTISPQTYMPEQIENAEKSRNFRLRENCDYLREQNNGLLKLPTNY